MSKHIAFQENLKFLQEFSTHTRDAEIVLFVLFLLKRIE